MRQTLGHPSFSTETRSHRRRVLSHRDAENGRRGRGGGSVRECWSAPILATPTGAEALERRDTFAALKGRSSTLLPSLFHPSILSPPPFHPPPSTLSLFHPFSLSPFHLPLFHYIIGPTLVTGLAPSLPKRTRNQVRRGIKSVEKSGQYMMVLVRWWGHQVVW